MKKNFSKNAIIACVFTLFLSVVFTTSCKNDDPAVQADVTKLSALIDSCQTLLSTSTTNDYPQTSIATFTTVLTTAKTAVSNTGISQVAVDNLIVQLRTARTVFLSSAYGAIPESALVMGMSFDETISNNQFKTKGRGWTAVLKTGPSEIFNTNTALPTFEAGRIGKAIHFEKGSHLEINDYAASDITGKQLSIALWVKPKETRAGNYIMSYNYWNTWKFNLQTENKPFFTVKTDGGIVDADNERPESAKNGEWTHLVVSLDLTKSKLNFFVSGQLVKSWDVTGKPNLRGSMATYAKSLPLLVGGCTTYAEAKASFDWSGWDTPTSWDYFSGSMDELKVYNIALTEGQVSKLYKEENK